MRPPTTAQKVATVGALTCLLGGALFGCHGTESRARVEASREVVPAPGGLSPLPPLASAKTTAELAFGTPAVRAPGSQDPAWPESLQQLAGARLGERAAASPWKAVVKTPDGKPAPRPGPHPKRISRFVHVTDIHVADDESPARLVQYDRAEMTTAAMRPQEGYGCRLLLAAVRTIRALHDQDALQLVLLGGDTIDSAQDNELGWALDVIGGSSRVECDSGTDDDPVAGPDNDPKDPFASAGVGAPSLWVTGNHDVTVQGNFPVDAAQRARALGSDASAGTRNYQKPGAPAETGAFVVPDSRRALLSRRELLARVKAHDGGHGIGAHEVEVERATYAWDPPGSAVRIVVLDTAHAAGGASGVLTRRDVDTLIRPLLDAALAEQKIVILAAHHGVGALSREGGTFGTPEPDAVLEGEWLDVLAAYPNVVASFVGHSHRHGIRSLRAGSRALWEITTGALVDYPNQLRLVELFDEDNGWLSLRATTVDVATEGDPLGEEARRRAQIDFVAGWQPDGRGPSDQRNVVLWMKKPR